MSDKVSKHEQNVIFFSLIKDIKKYIDVIFTEKETYNTNFKKLEDTKDDIKKQIEQIEAEFEKNIRTSLRLLDENSLKNLLKRFDKMKNDEDNIRHSLEPLESKAIKEKEKLLQEMGSIVRDILSLLKNIRIKVWFWPITFIEWESMSLGKLLIDKGNYEEIKKTYQKQCNKDNKSEFMIWLRLLYAILKSEKKENEKTIIFDINDDSILKSYLEFTEKFPFAKNHKESKAVSLKYLWYVRKIIEYYKLDKIVTISDKRTKWNLNVHKIQIQA